MSAVMIQAVGTSYLKMTPGMTQTNFPAFPGQIIRWKLSDPRNHKIDSIYPKPTVIQNIILCGYAANSVALKILERNC